jgi:peptidoglycan hydrolase-like protein with peptidoglycan-binding domain
LRERHPLRVSPSRRHFLKALGLLGLEGGSVFSSALPLLGGTTGAEKPALQNSKPFFTPIPPSISGIMWKHSNGRSQNYYLPETTGAGCAFIDYDNDGWMDIYLVNSGRCDFYEPDPPLRNALYRNNRDGTFTDVTEKAGVPGGGYGMGVAVGDYDGDGYPDLYVTQYGSSILYHNNGDGTFSDVTQKAGVAASGWASSAVWFDYDNDGRLDLFVCRFVDFSKGKNKFCGNSATRERYYCVPRVYDPMPSWLFHNNGDGTFADVSKESGIAQYPGKAWGVVACDINNDGHMDLFVANDTVGNFLLLNQGNGHFTDIGTEAGVAYNAEGSPRSGMGVDAADYDGDGWMDLFVANVDREMYSLYRNNHDNTFDDQALPTGIGKTTILMSGWGLKFFDFDNDGNLDLFLANGHPDDKVETRDREVQYSEPMLLFRSTGPGTRPGFVNVSAAAGAVFNQRFAARGMAIGDFDNDGAVDVLVAVNNNAPVLLRNTATAGTHWLGIQLVGKKANRDAIGASVTWQAGEFKRHRVKVGGGSYLATHDPRMVLGIGNRTKVDWIEVKWPRPSGVVERFYKLPIDRYVTLTEGEGTKVETSSRQHS